MRSLPSKKSSRRKIQKEETRRIIMASAYALFGLKGYEKTTMRQLAAHADVGLGTIFKHFPDKPSLLFSTFHEDLEAVVQNTFETLPPANIRMQLSHITAELYEFFGQNQTFSSVLLKETALIEGNCRELINRMGRAFQDKIESLLRQAYQRGELAGATDTQNIQSIFHAFLAFFLLGLVDGLREPELDVRKQTMFFASLLDSHMAACQPAEKL